MGSAHHIYTFGYEGMDITAFIARAQAAGVKTVVDVRELPLSRKKGFSKSSFREALAASGIANAHMPALGALRQFASGTKRTATGLPTRAVFSPAWRPSRPRWVSS